MGANTTTRSLAGLRTRWAAVGAALAVAVGAGGLGIVRATSPAGASAFVPITPCRLADSRPGTDHVGNIAGALVEDARVTLDAHGVQGNCDLPDAASGLALNVTAVNQTQLTYLTVWPADQDRPTTSNLNPSPGQPPTPNAVTVDLDPSGRFSIYNRFGTVDVIVDVVGYYADHHHDDRYHRKADTYTRAEVEALLTAPLTMTYRPEGTTSAGGCPVNASLPLAPLPVGVEILDVTAYVYASPGGTYRMWLYKGTGTGDNGFGVVASTGVVDAGSDATVHMASHDLTPAEPETVDHGEQYWFSFESQITSSSLCSVEVTYRPLLGS